MTKGMLVMVINLKSREDRRAHMERSMAECSIDGEFIEAVDGKDPASTVLMGPSVGKVTGKSRSRLDYACASSHFNCWERLAKSEYTYGLVLEDDVILSKDFNGFISTDWIPHDADIVKLETTLRKVRLGSYRQCPIIHRGIGMLLSPHLGAAAYAITKDAARRLLSEMPAPHDQVDWILFCEKLKTPNEMKIFQVNPSPAIQGMYHKETSVQEWSKSTLEADRLSRGFKPLVAPSSLDNGSRKSLKLLVRSPLSVARRAKRWALEIVGKEWNGTIEFR